MTRVKSFHISALFVAVLLWSRVASSDGGVLPVLSYSLAGVLSAVALVWIGRAFASLPFTRRSAVRSAVTGLVICTPAIALLLGPNTDTSHSAAVVLALTAAAIAAIIGSLWGIVTLAADAFGEWRHDRETGQLTLGGAHR